MGTNGRLPSDAHPQQHRPTIRIFFNYTGSLVTVEVESIISSVETLYTRRQIRNGDSANSLIHKDIFACLNPGTDLAVKLMKTESQASTC